MGGGKKQTVDDSDPYYQELAAKRGETRQRAGGLAAVMTAPQY